MDASRDVEHALWRRYPAIIIRGLSAEPGEPDPLAPGPLSPEQLDLVMAHAAASRR